MKHITFLKMIKHMHISERVALMSLMFFLIFPFLWIVYASLVNEAVWIDTGESGWKLLHFTLENYVMIYKDFNLLLSLMNSFMVLVFSSGLSVFLAAIFSFGARQWPKRVKNFVTIFVGFGMLIPLQMLIHPMLNLFSLLKLENNVLGLVFASVLFSLPFSIFVFMQYAEKYPHPYHELAMLDRLSEFNIFWRIELPSRKPAMFISGFFCMILSWNDTLAAFVLNPKPENETLSLAVTKVLTKENLLWVEGLALLSMVSMIAILIVICIKIMLDADNQKLDVF